MRGKVLDKILTKLDGTAILKYSLNAFQASGLVSRIVIIYRDQSQKSILKALLANYQNFEILWQQGGAERQNSVQNGLNALPPDTNIVFIHDCARPLLAPAMICKLLNAAERDGAAVLAHRVVDSIKRVIPSSDNTNCAHLENVEREHLWAMETPQVFKYKLILDAYAKVDAEKANITDDTAAAEFAGHPISVVENPYPNPKLTIPNDLALLEFTLQQFRDKFVPPIEIS